MLKEQEYNLLKEPWLRVMYSNGEEKSVNLIDVFKDAHIISGISGEMASQDVAILRFLLAITYRVVENETIDGVKRKIFDATEAYNRWQEYWKRGSFSYEAFEEYLESYEDRFYLIHPKRPFYQFPIDNGTAYKAKKLKGDVSESGNKIKIFSAVNGVYKNSLHYDEATRWLIHLMAYDDASLKPVFKESGLKMDSAKTGWLGRLSLVYIRGNNLFETLMMNLVLLDKEGEPFPDEKPIWEEDTIVLTERRSIPIPKNPIGVLTVQSRRVLLETDNGLVLGYKEYVGDQFADTCSNVEQMTMWKQDKDTNWVPKKITDSSHQMWRDYSSILARADDKMPPGVIRWCSELIDQNLIKNEILTIVTTNIIYAGGSIPSAIDEVVSDTISVNSKILSSLGETWNIRIDALIKSTEMCVWQYGNFIKNVMTINGAHDNVDKKTQVEKMYVYATLDGHFRTWIRSIIPGKTDMEMKCNEWLHQILETTLIDMAEEYLEKSDPKSLIYLSRGNLEKESSKRTPTSSIQELRFLKINLHKIIKGE